MTPVAFADSTPLDENALRDAPVRYPRPSRLVLPLHVDGAKAEHGASVLGLHTVGNLLEHLPRDRREARAIADLVAGETATVIVEVKGITSRSVRRRGMRPLVEATVADATGVMKVAFFNQPWLVQRYPPGTRLMLHGKYQSRSRFSVQAHAPTGEAATGSDAVAHYPATEGLSSTQILALVQREAGRFADVVEPLPLGLRIRERLADRASALRAAHFPASEADSEGARRRLAFDELLLVQLALLRRRRRRRAGARAPVLDEPRSLTSRWLTSMLPFPLTRDQELALEAVDGDIARGEPMQRLLMGEVGSGKTVVALYAMLRAVEHDMQGAMMAPTETLAEQHFATIQSLMPGELVRAGLLTGSTPARRRADLLAKLASGELSLIVGTHALDRGCGVLCPACSRRG